VATIAIESVSSITYVDTGKSANQTLPVETAAAKESDAKKLGTKKKKKFGIL
jgi:hypothetical protein